MKNYTKSDYAINKVRKGIVYRNADGSTLEITFEKIAAENPEFTQEDFKKLKELSDELYHEEFKSDDLEAHFVQPFFDENDERCKSELPSAEDEYFEQEERSEFEERLQNAIDTLLTPAQKRRLFLHCFRNMTVREIAKVEGSHFVSVHESIVSAKKKLKNFFINF